MKCLKKLKYGVTETNQNIHSDYSNKEKSGDNKSSSKEDVKEEEEDKSKFYESDQSNKGTTQEREKYSSCSIWYLITLKRNKRAQRWY